MQVNDMVFIGQTPMWVVGVYIAPPGGMSMVGLKRVFPLVFNKFLPEKEEKEMQVPLELLKTVNVWRKLEDES